MATARTPPHPPQESDMFAARQIAAAAGTRTNKSTMNPVLLVFLIALGAFPFVASHLPTALLQHLDVLFH